MYIYEYIYIYIHIHIHIYIYIYIFIYLLCSQVCSPGSRRTAIDGRVWCQPKICTYTDSRCSHTVLAGTFRGPPIKGPRCITSLHVLHLAYPRAHRVMCPRAKFTATSRLLKELGGRTLPEPLPAARQKGLLV